MQAVRLGNEIYSMYPILYVNQRLTSPWKYILFLSPHSISRRGPPEKAAGGRSSGADKAEYRSN